MKFNITIISSDYKDGFIEAIFDDLAKVKMWIIGHIINTDKVFTIIIKEL